MAAFGFRFRVARKYWRRETRLCIRQNRRQLEDLPDRYARRRLFNLIRQRQLQIQPIVNFVLFLIDLSLVPLLGYALIAEPMRNGVPIVVYVSSLWVVPNVVNAFYRFRCRQSAVRHVLCEAHRRGRIVIR